MRCRTVLTRPSAGPPLIRPRGAGTHPQSIELGPPQSNAAEIRYDDWNLIARPAPRIADRGAPVMALQPGLGLWAVGCCWNHPDNTSGRAAHTRNNLTLEAQK